jgi:hypothetical protein
VAIASFLHASLEQNSEDPMLELMLHLLHRW